MSDKIRIKLIQASQILTNLNLYQSAKWCAEALNGLEPSSKELSHADYALPQLELDEILDQDKFLLAKTYFNCKEFDRAAYVLRDCKSGNALFLRLYSMLISADKRSMEETDGSIKVGTSSSLSTKYSTISGDLNHPNRSTYANVSISNPNTSHINSDNVTSNTSGLNDSNALSSNINSNQHATMTNANNKSLNKNIVGDNVTDLIGGNSSFSDFLNSKLSKILQEISTYHSNPKNKPNAFLYYLNGVIHNKKKKYGFAQQSLFQSLRLFPYNWSCWQELIASLSTYEEALTFIGKLKKTKSSLSSNIMFKFFEVVIYQEFYQQSAVLNENLNSLKKTFPNFQFLSVQEFLIAYHSLDYFKAEELFDKILVNDPLRLDDLDTYSNMLYVMEKKSKLSFLAQFSSSIDKFRPETCCIIANYHSMKFEHEKAITYYKRALTLNKNCLSAWTLMGHEFVELKNSHAAIESYRRAVDTNPKDFRAWYGLGQAYEVLDMHMYALYYYQKATNLQPLDKRMWQALGNCYEKIDKLDEAIKSFEKAFQIDSQTNHIQGNGLTDDTGNEASSSNANGALIVVEPHITYKLATISEKLGLWKDTIKYMKMCLESELEWGISDESSKSRLWLARNALENRRFEEAYSLAKDLNHSNAHDIEEARSIAREARNRMSK